MVQLVGLYSEQMKHLIMINQVRQWRFIQNFKSFQQTNFFFFLVGTTRVWYLFILATDHGKPQRQCKHNILNVLMFFFFFCFSAFCSLRINLIDSNDNPPSKIINKSIEYFIKI